MADLRPLFDALPAPVRLADLQRAAIEHALRVTGGSVQKAAKYLGIGRATLYRRLAEFDLTPAPAAGSEATETRETST